MYSDLSPAIKYLEDLLVEQRQKDKSEQYKYLKLLKDLRRKKRARNENVPRGTI